MSNFSTLNKGALREAMRNAGLKYQGLNTEAMRAALEAHHAPATVEPGTPTDDAPVPVYTAPDAGSNPSEQEAAQAEVASAQSVQAPMPENTPVVQEPVAAEEVQEMELPELTDAQLETLGAQFSEAGTRYAEMSADALVHTIAAEQQVADEVAVTDAMLENAIAPTTQPRSTSKGAKIQKDRPQQNGVKMPSEGTLCRAVWDELQRSEDAGTPHNAKSIKQWAVDNGTNTNNAAIEFYSRRKYLGISKRRS